MITSFDFFFNASMSASSHDFHLEQQENFQKNINAYYKLDQLLTNVGINQMDSLSHHCWERTTLVFQKV